MPIVHLTKKLMKTQTFFVNNTMIVLLLIVVKISATYNSNCSKILFRIDCSHQWSLFEMVFSYFSLKNNFFSFFSKRDLYVPNIASIHYSRKILLLSLIIKTRRYTPAYTNNEINSKKILKPIRGLQLSFGGNIS